MSNDLGTVVGLMPADHQTPGPGPEIGHETVLPPEEDS